MSNKLYNVLPGKPANIEYIHKKGDTFRRKIRGFNEDGTPYDFTGHTFLMEIEDPSEKGVAVISIPDESFTITQDQLGIDAGVNNIVEIQHTETDFDTEFFEYIYDIQMTDASSVITTIQEGLFTVTDDVSEV